MYELHLKIKYVNLEKIFDLKLNIHFVNMNKSKHNLCNLMIFEKKTSFKLQKSS